MFGEQEEAVEWAADELAGQVERVRAPSAATTQQEPRAASVPARPATTPRREHHDECDKELYEGGTCTCDLIAELGAPSDREDPYWDNL
ncbi:hypothetical protein ACFWJ4_41130 [Kitasatospora sp. NPDC127067]|uniref:hypothetical protein n=1 Tax=Kitasatospora sp. NPDC127067 TaxID=3347126 RepID=UPI00365D899B